MKAGVQAGVACTLLLLMIASMVACGYFVVQMGMAVIRVFGLLYACLKGCAHC
jgi:hypothetical protein